MKICEYVVVKYLPDEIRKEPVNIGIIMREKKTGRIYQKFYPNLNQLSIRVPSANTELIYEFITTIKKLNTSDENSLNEMFQNFNHQIQFSEVMGTVCNDTKDRLEKLYKRFVSLSEIPEIQLIEKIESVIGSGYKGQMQELISVINNPPQIIAKDKAFQHIMAYKTNRTTLVDLYRDIDNSGVKRNAFNSREKKKI